MGVRVMRRRGAVGLPRFGVVGSGRMATTMMSTLRSAGIEIRAVAAGSQQRARSFADLYGVVCAHSDWRTLVARSDIDAVYIANATIDHAAVAIAALDAGKAVLCEKPLATDPAACAQVINAARRSGQLCMEGLWTAFLPAHRRFADIAASGVCGAPVQLAAEFGYPEPANSRLFSPETGGVLLDRAVYLIALAIKTMGPVAAVSSSVDPAVAEPVRCVSLMLQHDRGGRSQLAASFDARLSNTASLACTKGHIRIEEPLLGAESLSIRMAKMPDRPLAAAEGDARGRILNGLRRSALLRRVKRGLPEGVRERLPYGADRFRPEVDHFLKLMSVGAVESETIPLALSLEVLRVVERAQTVAWAPSLRAQRS